MQSLSDVHCGAKILSKKVIEKVKLTLTDFGFEVDIASQISKKEFDIFEYGISYFARTTKQGKKITWVDGIKTYFYLFKIRFIDNDFATQFSIVFSVLYMIYIGSHFGMGSGKILVVIFTGILGLFIGLYRKFCPSFLILATCYFGSLFSKGNGKIYTVVIGFFIGLYFSKKIADIFKNKNKNKFISFVF